MDIEEWVELGKRGLLSAEDVAAQLEANDKGRIRNTLSNCTNIFRYDPLLAGAICFNLLDEREYITRSLGWIRHTGPALHDDDFDRMRLYIEQTYGVNSIPNLRAGMRIAARERSYHPVRDLLSDLKWDGTERVRYALHHFFGAEVSDYTYEVMRLTMLGAINRVFFPGIKFDYMLCLVGEQGCGKSTFFRFLAIKDEWFTDDIKDLESEKVWQKMRGHIISEMSEMLAANNAKTNEAVKAFLSRQKETYRIPYDVYAQDHPRQCIFVGTTNKVRFLPNDRSGNRRFLPVMCDPKKADVFILDDEAASRAYILQMWAEMMEVFRNERPELALSVEVEAVLPEIQKTFRQEDTDVGMILDFMQNTTADRVCSRMLFREALKNETASPPRWQTNEICDIMNQLIATGDLKGWRAFDSPKRFPSYGTQKGWERIPAPRTEQLQLDGFSVVENDPNCPFS